MPTAIKLALLGIVTVIVFVLAALALEGGELRRDPRPKRRRGRRCDEPQTFR